MMRSISTALALACACGAGSAAADEQLRDRSFEELLREAAADRASLDALRELRPVARELHEFIEAPRSWRADGASLRAGVVDAWDLADGRKDWGSPLKDWGFEINHGWHDQRRSFGYGWTDPHCIPAVPEPSALLLLAGGLAVIAVRRRRDRRLP